MGEKQRATRVSILQRLSVGGDGDGDGDGSLLIYFDEAHNRQTE